MAPWCWEGAKMALYPISMSDRMEPLEEPEHTAVEWMGLCTHYAACERLYRRFVDDCEHIGWREDMARLLRCSDCEEWSA